MRLPMYRTASLLALCFASLATSPLRAATQDQQAPPAKSPNVVACRVIEVHASKDPGVVLVIFHQHDKQDQPRFAALLKQASGGSVEIQLPGASWQPAEVIRLKTCFGRGMLVLPAGAPVPKEGADLAVKFPQAAGGKVK